MFENKVIIIGNLTRKPTLHAKNDTKLTGLSVAVNSVWFDKTDGSKKESVEFISVTVFGKAAENCAQYLDKGQKVFVEGKIKNRVEETGEGTKKYHTTVVAQRVQFGPKPADQNKSNGNQPETVSTELEYPDEERGEIPF